MIPDQEVEIKWTPSNKTWYTEKGYKYTKFKDTFCVKVEDLIPTTRKTVKVVCDYCGEEFERRYFDLIKGRKTVGKDACRKCFTIKQKDVCMELYGVSCIFEREDIKEKIKETSLQKYGVDKPSKAEIVKSKMAKTNLERYGGKCTLQAPEIKAKAEETLMKNYGVKNPFESKEIQKRIAITNEERYGPGNIAHTPEIAQKIKDRNLEKYGVEWAGQRPDVIEKIHQSFYENGTVKTSKAEREMCRLLKEIYGENNCFPSFPFENTNFDCLVTLGDIKIDVEYDGWFWHKNKQERDKRRNYYVIKRGFRVLRFVANDDIPTKEQIIDGVNQILQEDKKLVKIILDVDI